MLNPSVSTPNPFSRWKSMSHRPRPIEPMISAMIDAVMSTLSTIRPAMFAAVPSSTTTNAIHACSVGVMSQPRTLPMKPAENMATAAIATTRVHM